MSNIYVNEPGTNGKIILNTTGGDICIELWSKEAPMACRNFVQHCVDGYYNGTIFHRLVKKFVLQGGDPTGTGDGGESIYGKPFKIETHSRLRFNRRGLVAMHCVDGKVHGSQFFFTLNSAPELQNNYTIFGSVVGDTLYNMLNMGDCLVDKETFRPINPKSINSVEVIVNPFKDIVQRDIKCNESVEEQEEVANEEEEKIKVKSDGPLSFGDLDDDDNDVYVKKTSKSAHDHSKHSNLSKNVVIIDPNDEKCVIGNTQLVPVDSIKYVDPDDVKRQEKLQALKKESESLKKQLALDMIKQQNPDKDDLDHEILENKMLDSEEPKKKTLDTLSDFRNRIIKPQANDWFFKAMTAISAEDDVEVAETKVIDPSLYNPDKYDLHDPRHPMNIRKRQGDQVKSSLKEKKTKI